MPHELKLPQQTTAKKERGIRRVCEGCRAFWLGLVIESANHMFASITSFDPSRFAPPREEDKQTRYGLVTFGAGSRICIGVNFAQIEVKLLVAHLLQRYHFAPMPEQPPIHRGYWIARTPGGVVLRVVRR